MQEFNRYLDISSRYFKGLNTVKIGKKIKNLLKFKNFEHLKSFGPCFDTIINPASSGEDSEEFSAYPSLFKVASRIIDTSSIVLTDRFEKTQHGPCILISPISQFLKDSQLFGMLSKNGVFVQSVQLIDLNSQYGKAALLWFQSEEMAEAAFEKFFKGDFRVSEGVRRIVNVKWVDYKVVYSGVHFFAAVVRGFSKKNTPAELYRVFTVKFCRCEIRVVDGYGCGVFVFSTLEDLCLVCIKMNGVKDSFGDVMKVHLHPLTQKKHAKAIFETLLRQVGQTQTGENEGSLRVLMETKRV